MELGNVSQPTYGPGLVEVPGSSVPGLVGMVHGFLRLVQPHRLPLELIADLLRAQGVVSKEHVEEVLRYELGFLVCTAIGLLFIVLVPLVGCCFCCCRCCGRCGGRMEQLQGPRTGCQRRALHGCVLLLSALLLAGDVCAFVSNSRFSQAVSSAFPNANSTVQDVHTFLDSIPQQVDFVIRSSSIPLGSANGSLQNIRTELGGRIVSRIRSSTDEALGALQSVLGVMETLEDAFSSINGTHGHLEELQGDYGGRLGTLRTRLQQTLQRCGQPCGTASPDAVAFATNYSTVPGVEQQLEALRDVLGSDIAGELQEIPALEEAPSKVQEQSQDAVTRTQQQLGHIGQEIQSLREELPLQDLEESVGSVVTQTSTVLGDQQENITRLDGLRWMACTVLCCLVLLVVLCNACGLLLGPLGLRQGVLPTQRSCISNAGGNFFMAGVGFSFIFSWLLMLVVLLTFLLGGNVYVLLCESWRSQQLFQLVDTPGLIPGFNVSELLCDESGTVNFSQLYRQCQQDAALWQALRLDQRLSLDKLLNISQYTGEISTAFQKLNITLGPISLLSESQREQLLNASRAAQPPDFTHTLQQLDEGVTAGSLLELAAELEQLVDAVGTDVKDDLRADAAALRELDRELQGNFSGPLKTLKESIQLVQSHAAQLEAQTESALDKANATQEFLRREMANIIKNETWAFLEELLGFFETYIAWAKSSLERDVARCKPIAQSLDNVEAIACDHILDSLNAFWFSLGWCTAFLLPSIVLAVRLAKFYRRMDIADVYGDEAMEIGPAFNMYKIPRPATRH